MNHEIPVKCPVCECEYDAHLHWTRCPCCGFDREKLSLHRREQLQPLHRSKSKNDIMDQEEKKTIDNEDYKDPKGCRAVALTLLGIVVFLVVVGCLYLFT